MTRAERFRLLTCTRAVRADLATKSVRATALATTFGFTDFAVRIGSTALLARLVLPEHFGLIMMVTAITAIADQLRDLGLSTATVQQKEISHEEVSNLFWINVGASTLFALGICALSPLIAAYYHEPRLTVVTCILASTLVFGGLTVQHQALLTRQLRLGETSAIRLASSVFSTVLAIALAWGGWGYWALLWREVARAALLGVGIWIRFPWIPALPSRDTDVRGLLRFGANLTTANILTTVAAGADRFLLGRFWGPSPVAMYRQAFQLISAPTDQILSPLYQVTNPCLSMLQGDPARYRRFYAKVLTTVCMATMPLSLFVAVYANEITSLLLGARWSASTPLLAVLSISAFIKQPIGSTAFIPVTLGDGGTYLRLTILQNVLLVAFMAIGVFWGAIGVATGDVVATYLMMWPRLYYSLRGSPVSVRSFFTAMARPATASIVMALVLLVLRTQVPVRRMGVSLSLGAVVGTILFATTWLLLPGGFSELRDMIAQLRSALRRRSAPAPAAEDVVAAS